MREQKSRDPGIQRGDDEDGAAQAHGVDPDALAHQPRAIQRADRPPDTAIEQTGGHRHHDRNNRPDHTQVDPLALGGQRGDAQRRDVADAIEAMQQRQRAEQSEKAHAPRHRNKRQKVTGQSRGHQPEQPRGRSGNDKPDNQAGDRRSPGELRQQRGGVGCEADEARLSKRSLPTDAGQQHQAERDQRRQSDITEQRDIKRRQHIRNDHDNNDRREQAKPMSPGSHAGCGNATRRPHARSSGDPLRNDSHTRIGISKVNTITSR